MPRVFVIPSDSDVGTKNGDSRHQVEVQFFQILTSSSAVERADS